MSDLLRCEACGGAVIWDAAKVGAACLFCGTVALALELGEWVPEPELVLPAKITRAEAEQRFRAWATSSWLRPSSLRDAELSGLHLMLLPAWRVHAKLETHWAGLRRARKRKSGKTPVAGLEHAAFEVMVPASGGLSQAELSALQPFDEALARAWTGAVELDPPGDTDPSSDTDPAETIWEPPSLTRRGARAQAHALLGARHRKRIIADQGLLDARVSSLMTERSVQLLLVPIYIGAFRFNERPWRFLVNAQTGVVVGEAPLDWRKLFAIGLAVLLLVGLIAWWRGAI